MTAEKPYVQSDILKNLIIRLVELRTPEKVAQMLAETVSVDILETALDIQHFLPRSADEEIETDDRPDGSRQTGLAEGAMEYMGIPSLYGHLAGLAEDRAGWAELDRELVDD